MSRHTVVGTDARVAPNVDLDYRNAVGFVFNQEPGHGSRTDVAPATEDQSNQIRARIKRLNDWAVLLGVVGLGLQAFGRTSTQPVLMLAGTGVLVVALALYARMRGREPWWGALGLLSLLGLVALYLLPKRCHHCGATVKDKACSVCGAPAPL